MRYDATTDIFCYPILIYAKPTFICNNCKLAIYQQLLRIDR